MSGELACLAVEVGQPQASEPDDLAAGPDLKKFYGLNEVDKHTLWSCRISFLGYLALLLLTRLLDRPYWWILPVGLLVSQSALFAWRYRWSGLMKLLGMTR